MAQKHQNEYPQMNTFHPSLSTKSTHRAPKQGKQNCDHIPHRTIKQYLDESQKQ